jgi:ribosome-binding factor A
MTPDLRQAKIYVSVYGDGQEKEKSIKGLKSARGFIQGEIGRRARLRHTPEIFFRLDESLEKGAQVLKKMNEISPPEVDKKRGEL